MCIFLCSSICCRADTRAVGACGFNAALAATRVTLRACMCFCVCMFVCVCMCACVCARVRARMRDCVCVCVCVQPGHHSLNRSAEVEAEDTVDGSAGNDSCVHSDASHHSAVSSAPSVGVALPIPVVAPLPVFDDDLPICVALGCAATMCARCVMFACDVRQLTMRELCSNVGCA